MEKKIIPYFLSILCIAKLYVIPLHAIALEGVEEFLIDELCVTIPPKSFRDDQQINYSKDTLKKIIDERFDDVYESIHHVHIPSWKKLMRKKIQIAIDEKKYVPYILGKIPKGERPKFFSIKSYLSKLQDFLKRTEKARIAEIVANNSVTIEELMYEILKENPTWFKDRTPEQYAYHLEEIRKEQMFFQAALKYNMR